MVSVLTLTAVLAYYKLRKRKRRFGVHPILRQRKQHGHFHNLFKDLRAHPDRFHRFVRMDEARFYKLLSLVQHRLVKKSRREPLSPAERLLITLRYLATGNNLYSVSNAFYVGESTVGQVVAETCRAIAEELRGLPHALGAIDGKHVQIRAPPRSGTTYHNYKGTFSTVLLAMCDHSYRIKRQQQLT